MIFTETRLRGAYEISLEPHPDERGSFARSFCTREFEAHGLRFAAAQSNISFNRSRGTLRGMHYQLAPNQEGKLIQCIRGALYDVIVDLRTESPTFRQWIGIELLTVPGRPSKIVYAPPGFAHGFLTLEDDTEIFYQMSEFYAPESARGFRWNDPAIAVEWPAPIRVISERDRTYPDFVVQPAQVTAS